MNQSRNRAQRVKSTAKKAVKPKKLRNSSKSAALVTSETPTTVSLDSKKKKLTKRKKVKSLLGKGGVVKSSTEIGIETTTMTIKEQETERLGQEIDTMLDDVQNEAESTTPLQCARQGGRKRLKRRHSKELQN